MRKIIRSLIRPDWRERTLRRVFPEVINNVWLAWNGIYPRNRWHYQIPYWDHHGKYIDHQIGEVFPLVMKHGRTAFYRIDKIKRASWMADLAPFDDGRKYSFRLVRIENGFLD